MKKILTVLVFLSASLFLSTALHADVSDFKDEIYSGITKTESSEIGDRLSELGIDPDDPESVANLKPDGILSYVFRLIGQSLKKPIKIILAAAVFSALCMIAEGLSFRAGLYSELFVMICFLALSPTAIEAYDLAANAMKGAQLFMNGYIPAFAAVAAASGNAAAAASYNALTLYFCEAASLVASTVLKPLLACMLVMSAAQAIDPDIVNLTSAMRNFLTIAVGFIMTLFLGVIGLQSIVGRSAESLAVRAGKYAVSSFVPVIGYSLSESYKAVSLSLSAIRTAVGTFGMIVLFVYMLAPIITAAVYKAAFSASAWICRLCGADRLAALMSGLCDVFGFAVTLLLVYMLMLTVSTGMLVILGGELLL